VMSDKWRLAKSLVRLTDEIKTEYPGTTVWDIGDQAHQSGWSDHNRSECSDVVCAIDVKSDGGMYKAAFVRHLLANPHPDLRYVIYNRKIYQRKNNFAAQGYSGVNAHTEHVHVSVGNGPDQRSTSGYDSTESWGIADLGEPSAPAKPSKPSTHTTTLGDKMPTLERGSKGKDVRRLQGLLAANGHKVSMDGIFGRQTEKAVRSFQDAHARPVDGVVGKVTWNALLGV
jgi:hypothetical protein